MNRKPFLIALSELIVVYWPRFSPISRRRWRRFLPTPGNVLFTLLVVAALLWAQTAGAIPLQSLATTSSGTIAYQGRLADSNGNPIEAATFPMVFRLYASASVDANPLWTEHWTSSNEVEVSDGLFNVMLGSLEPIPQSIITGNDTLFLGISVGNDNEMSPRIQLGNVPFAVQALSVPDGSITTAKLAAGAVTSDKLASNIGGSPVIFSHVGGYTHTGTTWADISSEVSLTINSTAGQRWLIISAIPGAALTSGASGWINYDLAIDGTRVSNAVRGLAVSEHSSNYEGGPVTMVWVTDLSAGSHTIRPQWRAEDPNGNPDTIHTLTATFTIIAIPFQ